MRDGRCRADPAPTASLNSWFMLRGTRKRRNYEIAQND
jgi:hypothetical protein